MEYQLINGTSYHEKTDKQIIKVLENAKVRRLRLKISFGDTNTGRDWNEIHDIYGYIGRSTGEIKVPLLVYNKKSYGAAHYWITV